MRQYTRFTTCRQRAKYLTFPVPVLPIRAPTAWWGRSLMAASGPPGVAALSVSAVSGLVLLGTAPSVPIIKP